MATKAVEQTKQNAQPFATGLAKVTQTFAPMIERQLNASGLRLDPYAKQCVINAIGAINQVLEQNMIKWDDPNLDRNNITHILLNIAALKLNAAAHPREVFFQLRNVKRQSRDGKKEEWRLQIEMGIEGDGNDAILARFGRDVAKVGQYWLVRENDEFHYPEYNGLEVTPPRWKPTGKGKVVRVVYPILKKDGSVEYLISERDDVVNNLLAHVANNLMNETFGLASNRRNATPDQLKKIAEKKKTLLQKVREKGLDALDDPELQPYISPAWREPHSREAMIVRKMRNNAVKKYPKDFRNPMIEYAYTEATDEEVADIRQEMAVNANREIIDIEPLPSDEPQEPTQQSQLEHEPTPETEQPAPAEEAADEPGEQTLDLWPDSNDDDNQISADPVLQQSGSGEEVPY